MNETYTPLQYRRKVLESADADGWLDPPTLVNWWAQSGLMMGMHLEGLIERRGTGPKLHRTGPWCITDAGAAWLRSNPTGTV